MTRMYVSSFISLFALLFLPVNLIHISPPNKGHSLRDVDSAVSSNSSNTQLANHTRSLQGRNTELDTFSVGGTISHLIDTVWDDLRGLGSSENVTIT